MVEMGTLGGFPTPPALWLRRAKPGPANAIVNAGTRRASRVRVSESVFVGGTRTAPRSTHSPHEHATALAHGTREPRAGLLLERRHPHE